MSFSANSACSARDGLRIFSASSFLISVSMDLAMSSLKPIYFSTTTPFLFYEVEGLHLSVNSYLTPRPCPILRSIPNFQPLGNVACPLFNSLPRLLATSGFQNNKSPHRNRPNEGLVYNGGGIKLNDRLYSPVHRVHLPILPAGNFRHSCQQSTEYGAVDKLNQLWHDGIRIQCLPSVSV